MKNSGTHRSSAASEADIVVSNLSLHVRRLQVAADAPTIVFLHDALGSIETWRAFPETLCEITGCNGLVYDRQGHGKSSPFTQPRTPRYLYDEAAVLAAVLSFEGISEAILFGHSDGGSIVLMAAAQSPDRIAAVISEAAHVFVEDFTVAGVQAAKESAPDNRLLEKLARYHGDKSDRLFSAWADTWTSAEYRDFNMESLLPQIHCPVLAIQGVDDQFGTAAQVEAIVSQVGGRAERLMIPGAQHTPHKETPDVVLAAAAGFIQAAIKNTS